MTTDLLSLEQPTVVNLSQVIKVFKIGDIKLTILKDLDFQCREKEFIILTGPSGSGKSTILSIIGGLMQVDKGTVKIFDHNLTTIDEEDLAIFRSTYIGFVFQTGHLIDSLTVLENVMLPVELAQRIDLVKHEKRAWELLEEFKLCERANSLPVLISGGEYQRCAFIRAFILDPDLLLIDEPTSNQDKQTTESIINKLSTIKGKKTIIVITHDRKIFPLADRILIPKDGKLIPYEKD
ncbi:MAG: ABC transporter ATP-binding protein [Candidatus Hodarchaeota archaeon]